MNRLLSDTARRAVNYLEKLDSRSVAPDAAALSRLPELREALPENGMPATDVIAQLDEIGSPASMAMSGPRFYGFVIGGSLPASLAANWLSTTWDQNVCLHEVTPLSAVLEQVAADWLLNLLDLPDNCASAFVTGATVANFTALAAARHALLKRAGWNVEADGLFGAPEITVVIGDEAHPSMIKSLGLLGLGRDRVTRVPTDSRGQIRADQLPDISGPTLFCTQVGNVNTGGSDPINAIADHLEGKNAWIHVDGAFGLWLRASKKRAHLVAGLERADSWATDAHKWLNVPYDSGLAFTKDAEALRAAMSISAAYLPVSPAGRDPSDYTPELSRRGRGTDIWAAIKQLGRSGVEAMIDRCCDHAERFAAGFKAAGIEVLSEVVMNQVLVSFGDEARNQRIIRAIQEDGTCWCGITQWQGKSAMRISVSNWATSEEDVDKSLTTILRLAQEHNV